MNNCCQNRDKDSMLRDIMALNFAVNDLVLYLDTHPFDCCAIKMHSKYAQEVINLTEEYQNLYGPITVNFTSNNENCWQWSENPWPWERGAY